MGTRPREKEKAQETSQAGLVVFFEGQQIRNKRSIDNINRASLLACFSDCVVSCRTGAPVSGKVNFSGIL